MALTEVTIKKVGSEISVDYGIGNDRITPRIRRKIYEIAQSFFGKTDSVLVREITKVLPSAQVKIERGLRFSIDISNLYESDYDETPPPPSFPIFRRSSSHPNS